VDDREATDTWESRDELLTAAAEAGMPISGTQLSNLHRAGLIERPMTRGLGRGLGRESRYPPGSVARLLRVLEARRGVHSLETVAWRLWWEDGGPVPQLVRRRLLRTAEEFEDARERFAELLVGDEQGAPDAEVEMDAAYRAAEKERMPTGLGRVRGNVGRQDFATVMRVMLEVVAGRFQAYRDDGGDSEPSTESVVEEGLGIDRSRRDSIGDVGPWFEGSSADDLRRVSTAISSATPTALADADDAELDEARRELRALFQTIAETAAIIVRLIGRGALGLDTVASLFAGQPESLQPFLLLLWMELREDRELREGMSTTVAALPEAIAGRAALEVLIGLREQSPAFAGLSDALLRGVLVDPDGKEALEIQRLVRENRAQVDKFVADNPELAIRAGLIDSEGCPGSSPSYS
jgi:hypothetical protein